jgi:hypothetical protein
MLMPGAKLFALFLFVAWLFATSALAHQTKVADLEDILFHPLKFIPRHVPSLRKGARSPASAPTLAEAQKAEASKVAPIVLIAPMTGSVLMATWKKTTKLVSELCDAEQTTPYELWLTVDAALSPGPPSKCMLDNLRMDWNATASEYMDRGVSVSTRNYAAPPGGGAVVQPGYIFGVDFLGSTPGGSMYASLRDALVTKAGYEVPAVEYAADPKNTPSEGWERAPGQIAVIPYDWRLGPRDFSKPGADFDRLRKFLETSRARYSRGALVVSMSMGGAFFHRFLAGQTQAWKDEHVEGWISAAGVFGGSLELLMDAVAGPPPSYYGVPWFPAMSFRDASSHWGSSAFLAPIATGDAQHDSSTMVETPAEHFAFNETMALLRSVAARQSREEAAPSAGGGASVASANGLEALSFRSRPGVPTWCFYSGGVPTTTKVSFSTDDFDPQGKTVHLGDGDGTVMLPSLRVCEAWGTADNALDEDAARRAAEAEAGAREGAFRFESKMFHNITHSSILGDGDVIAEIVKVALSFRR